MRLRRKIIRPRKLEDKRKSSFFSKPGAEEKTPFFSGANGLLRKLNVGKSNDPQEKEADSVAKQLTRQQVQRAEKKEEEKPIQKAEKKEEEKPIQKAEKKEEEKPVQKADMKEEEKPIQKAETKEEEEPVQKAESKNEGKPVQRVSEMEESKDQDSEKSSFENLLVKRKGMGFAMPDDLRKDMEGKFRTSFREVRIHINKEAADMCETIHALAFSHGYDIYFNEGMYNPEALSGRELLAHELAHVVQQNG